MHRRSFLAGAAALPVVAAAAPAFGSVRPKLAAQTLDQLAKAKGLLYFGSATDNPELTDTTYTSLLGSQFGSITPGNTMKWQYTEPTQGQFDFSKADVVVALAQQHNQIIRGHNLVWHNQLPSWVSSLPTSQVQAAMENHIATEAGYYAGTVYSWDVVNEPLNDDGTFRADAFYNGMGQDYIAIALQAARDADPNAKLYINDYNIEYTGTKSNAMYSLVQSLVQQGVPLDGIGFQGHLAIQYGYPDLQNNLQRFADLGLDVAVTELDVRMVLPRDSTKDATQATYYANVVNACLAVDRCVGITVWDYTDKYSWVPSTFSGQGAACPWDENFNTKPAYDSIVTALGGTSSGGGGGGTAAVGASYHVDNDWGSGFTATVTVTNTGTAPVSSWQVGWSWGGNQTVTNSWNTGLTQSGTAVTAKNASYNGTIAVGAATTFGFQASYSGTNAAPTLTASGS